MSIRLILDTTGLLAYVAGDTRALDLGELMANVGEGGDITGVPALCLVTALGRATDEQRAGLLRLTGDDGPAVVVPVLADDVVPIAALAATLSYDLAHAATAATAHGALLGTYDRGAYGGAMGVEDEDILDL